MADLEILEMLRDAEHHFYKNEFDQAKDLYMKVIQKDKDNEEACERLIKIYAVKGLYKDVISQSYELVRILDAKGNQDKALEVAYQTKALQPEDECIRKKLILILKRKNDSANFLLETSNLVQFYLEKELEDNSIMLIEKLIQLFPDNYDLELKLADTHLKVGHMKEAIDLYKKMGEKFLEKGMKKEAADAYRKLKVITTLDMLQLMTLADLLQDLGELDAAEDEYRSALKQDINNIAALTGLSEVCMKKGCYRDAIIAYNKILNLNPQDISVKEKLFELHFMSGNKTQAVKYALEIAIYYQSNGNLDEAVKFFKKVLEIEPLNPTALREMESLEKLISTGNRQIGEIKELQDSVS